jgi:hypothetical protein
LLIANPFRLQILIAFLSSNTALGNTPGGAVLKPSEKVSYVDIKVGLPGVLLCVELVIVSLFHLSVYSWKPYQIHEYVVDADNDPKFDSLVTRYQGGRLGYRALLAALNPWDIIKSFARAIRWIFRDRKRRSSTETDSLKDAIPLQSQGEANQDRQYEKFVWA